MQHITKEITNHDHMVFTSEMCKSTITIPHINRQKGKKKKKEKNDATRR